MHGPEKYTNRKGDYREEIENNARSKGDDIFDERTIRDEKTGNKNKGKKGCDLMVRFIGYLLGSLANIKSGKEDPVMEQIVSKIVFDLWPTIRKEGMIMKRALFTLLTCIFAVSAAHAVQLGGAGPINQDSVPGIMTIGQTLEVGTGMTKIRNLDYLWPASYTTNGFLKTSDTGTLSWESLDGYLSPGGTDYSVQYKVGNYFTGNEDIKYFPTNVFYVLNASTAIGTTATTSMFQVAGNSAFGYPTSTTGPANGIAVAGRVGIGITNPSVSLEVQGDVKVGNANASIEASSGKFYGKFNGDGSELTGIPFGGFSGVLPIYQGGTGTGELPTNGKVMIGDTNGGGGNERYVVATLTPTTNQVNITNGAGSITFSLPQSIHTGANVTFETIDVGSLTASLPIFTDANKQLTSSGTVPINRGGTNATAFTANSVFFFDGTSFAEDIDNLVWVNAQNRLGIGISTPTVTLDVQGDVRIGTNDASIEASTGKFYGKFNGDASELTGMPFSGFSGILPITMGGTATSELPTNGKVLIGDTNGGGGNERYVVATLTPTTNQVNITNGAGSITFSLPQSIHTGANVTFETIDVGGLTASLPVFTDANKQLTSSGTVPINRGGTNNTAFTAGAITFFDGTRITEDATNLFWDNTGNGLGIGTSTPSVSLEVQGDVKIGNQDASIEASTGKFYGKFNGDASELTGMPFSGFSGVLPIVQGGTANDSYTAGSLIFYDSTGSGILEEDNANLFWDNAQDRLGLGTNAPQNRLDVEGAAAIGASYSGTETAPANGLIVQGSVGIGTAEPTTTLQVVGTVEVSGSMVLTGNMTNVPSAVQSVAAGTGITAGMLSSQVLLVQGDQAGTVDISANPQIAAGANGQMLTLVGNSDTNLLKLDNSNGLQTSGANPFTLGAGDVIQFIYVSGVSRWIETSRTDN